MIRALVVVLLLLAAPVSAQDWSAEEKTWAAAWLTTMAVDWGQTRYIARHPDRFRELNPMLPDHPTLGQVNRHFLVGTALMFAAAHYMPTYRTGMLQVWFGLGVIGVARNAHLGVRFEF